MKNMILDLEMQILDQIINEGKDPVDASIKEQIAEWKALKKKLAVVSKIAKAITDRVNELEKSFEEVVKDVDGKKAVIDGAILEYTQKKGNRTVKYKEVVDYALKMVNEAQKQVLEAFIATVTNPGETTDVLAVTDPELEQFLLQLKGLKGEELMDKIETMARSGFEKLPRQLANAKKRELKEGVVKNVAKVVANLVRTFKTKFKAVFKALDKSDKAVEALVKAVGAPDTVKESVVTEDQNYTDFGQWQSACKQGRENVWFDGDETECSAYQGEQPFTQGQTTLVGSWNGKSGTASAPPQSESLVLEKAALDLDLKKGAFHKWLGKKEGEKLTKADIEKGLKSDDEHVREMAQFAKNSEEWVKEGLVTEAASAWERLETLKKEFRALGDEIDNRVKDGEDVTLEDKTIKKMVKLRDKMGALNKKLNIPRPGDIK
jgi:hypothetical protein